MFGPESQADQPGLESLEEWKAGEQANWNGRPQGGVRGADIGGSKNLNRIANSRPPACDTALDLPSLRRYRSDPEWISLTGLTAPCSPSLMNRLFIVLCK